MKIAILAPGGFDRSGTERVIPCLLWMLERLVKCGDEVHVFVLRQKARPGQWPLLGACVHNAGGPNALMRATRTLRALRKEHLRGPFDVIHALWAVPQGILAGLASMAWRVPVLLHLPGGDLARLPEIGYGGRATTKGRLALRLALRGADRIAVPSLWMVEQARNIGIVVERVPFGVALDYWPVVPPRRRTSGAPAKLVHVANLNLVKDQSTLMEAAAELRAQGTPFVLDIVGEDTLHGTVMQHADKLGLRDCVRFHGFLPQRALREHVYAADLLVVTSRHEAGPVVALEAAVAGVPSVGTHVGVLADWAPEAARTVSVRNAHALARTMAELLSDEDERLRLAGEAQKRAVAESADQTTMVIRNLYLSMAAAGRRKHPATRMA